MPRKTRSSKTQPARRRGSGIPADLDDTLRKALPDGIVELQASADESWFAEVEDELRSRLSRLDGADVEFEKPAEPSCSVQDDEDDWEEPPACNESSRSFHLFFVVPNDSWARCQIELERSYEDDQIEHLQGTELVGCAIGVSLLAKVALVRLTSLIIYGDGSSSIEPSIHPNIIDEENKPVDPHDYWARRYQGEELRALLDLEQQVSGALASLGIRLLSDQEAAIVVPDLRVGEACLEEPVQLCDAFFFAVP
ncbi:MAG: hypothetical protein V2A73_16265 [Pseudomonadota bacterium]